MTSITSITDYSITVFEKQSLGVIDQSLWHTTRISYYVGI